MLTCSNAAAISSSEDVNGWPAYGLVVIDGVLSPSGNYATHSSVIAATTILSAPSRIKVQS